MGGLRVRYFLLFVVACRSLVGGMFVALALPLQAVERCDDARRVGAVVMVKRISFISRPWRLSFGSEDHVVPLRHPAYLLSLLSCNSDELDLANYQIH